MAIQQASDEADIRQRIGRLVEALRAMDLEDVMSFYAPDIVSFDMVPPLRHAGAKAKERNWLVVHDQVPFLSIRRAAERY
jgi:ketosteroid isomerase-like protein